MALEVAAALPTENCAVCFMMHHALQGGAGDCNGACMPAKAFMCSTHCTRHSQPLIADAVHRGRQVALEVASALLYLHTRPQKIVHYDLKAANVLLTRDGRAKLADVGERTWSCKGICFHDLPQKQDKQESQTACSPDSHQGSSSACTRLGPPYQVSGLKGFRVVCRLA